MKRYFPILIFVLASVPCHAQWQFGGSAAIHVYAFGAHDSSYLFMSTAPFQSYTTQLWRRTANIGWTSTDSDIDFSQGNVTSFASLGRYVFAGQTQSNGTNDGEYSSTDNGSHWSAVNIGSPVISNGFYLLGQDYNARDIPFIARSGDSGKSWDSLKALNAMGFAANGTCIYASTGSAIWRSTDTGNTWSQLTPQPSFVGLMTTMESLLFITAGGNVIVSTDSGSSWNPVAVDSAGVPMHVNVLATDGKILFAGTASGVLMSTDHGQTWRSENAGLTKSTSVYAMGVFDTLLFVANNPGDSVFFRSIPEMRADTGPASVVEQLPPGDSILLHPNPTMSQVSIFAIGTSVLGIRVLNVLGEPVLSTEYRVPSDVSLDLSKLPSETYFLEIETMNGIVLRKIVKE